MDRWVNKQINMPLLGQMNAEIGRWMNEWMIEHMDRRTNVDYGWV